MPENNFTPFSLTESPLKGTNLIESSAGTGKTYTITGLYLRLLLEKDLTVDQILVVTFTEAATAELNDRIRARLRDMLEVLRGNVKGDPFLTALAAAFSNKEAAIGKLKKAVADFDEASIFTIHSFCRRMLNESAFESGSLFDTELVTDQSDIKMEVIEDFWRQKFYDQDPAFLNYALERVSIEKLFQFIGSNDSRTGLKVVPELKEPDSSAVENEFKALYRQAAGIWKAEGKDIAALLADNPSLNKNSYNAASVYQAAQRLDVYFDSDSSNVFLPAELDKFTTETISKRTNKSGKSPVHPFFTAASLLTEANLKLMSLFETRLTALKGQLFNYVRKELKKRKERKNVQCFDDLLLNLHAALTGDGAQTLAARIREKYKAALIDEFQDTDPVQYEIFSRIFTSGESILFLIGDPKQAIYGFRGADIFAYMKASESSDSRYTLGENWRSQPDLIKAVNTIFNGCHTPFIYKGITFEDALAPKEKLEQERLIIDGESTSPFHIWFLPSDGKTAKNKPLSKSQAEEIAAKSAASHISKLLLKGRSGKASTGSTPLTEKDIAVLVRTNLQANVIQKELSALLVPSVIYSAGNLFDSEDASETLRIISCIAEPEDESRICSALSTDIWGLNGNDIEGVLKDDFRWEELVLKLREYNRKWLSQGFISMFRDFMKQEGIMNRLMRLPGGERRLTNLLHLSELLHQASIENNLSPQSLVKWLSEKTNPDSERSDEHQLRLESDERAVKIITIHKSKGLEYPVVFCPFLWDVSLKTDNDRAVLYHDEKNEMQPVLDIGSENISISRSYYEKEQLAENLRLLYVALTRAKNRCYIIWGRINGAGKTGPALLFHNRHAIDPDRITSGTEEKFSAMEDSDILRDIKSLAECSDNTIDVYTIPDEKGAVCSPYSGEKIKLSCREFKGVIKKDRHLTSFSSLIYSLNGRKHEIKIADEALADDIINNASPDIYRSEEENIFSFPRGANAGSCLHKIFEEIDFTNLDRNITDPVILKQLDCYGFSSKWTDTVYKMLSSVLSIPLAPESEGLILSNISPADRLNELEFYFPLKKISPSVLKDLFTKREGINIPESFSGRIGSLSFLPQEGFMRGFIDMVFRYEGRYYLIDWKSNHLGNSAALYTREYLEPVMQESLYTLQYHIYTLALNRFLSLRIKDYNYERDFGGVFYVFLRGADTSLGNSAGIYFDKPGKLLIEDMENAFIDKSGL